MPRLAAVLSILAFWATWPAHGQQHTLGGSSVSPVGCYQLHLGAWSGPFPSRSAGQHQPPARFQLGAHELLPPVQGYYEVQPDFEAVGAGRFPPRWRRLAGDTLAIYWSTGFAGVRLKVRHQGRVLRGIATAEWDVKGPSEPTARVVATRIRCQCLERGWLEPCE